MTPREHELLTYIRGYCAQHVARATTGQIKKPVRAPPEYSVVSTERARRQA